MRDGVVQDAVFMRADGTRLPGVLSAGLSTALVGHGPTSITAVRDVSARQAEHAALAADRDCSRAVLNVMREGWVVTGSDNAILDVNPALCHMTGFSCAE